jgi:deoxyribonucleoside regulator
MTPHTSNLSAVDDANQTDLLVRTAWLYFIENLTQDEIARDLGISRIKVVRMIKEARERGIVEIKVQSAITKNLKLESELRSIYQLTHVVVTLPEQEGDLLNKVLACSAAQLLGQRLKPGIRIGVGIGRTTYHLTDFFAPPHPIECTFISLAGGFIVRGSFEDSYETILTLSRLAGGKAQFIYAPFLVTSAEIREAVLQDKVVESVFNQARQADLAIFSVGIPDDFALLHQYNLITSEEMADIRSQGALGDALGRFFNENGEEILTSYRDRVIGLTINELRAIPMRILVAGGQKKYQAIRAALAGKIANMLVTDIRTAEWLVENVNSKASRVGDLQRDRNE